MMLWIALSLTTPLLAETVGTPTNGPPGVSETTATITARHQAVEPGSAPIEPDDSIDRSHLPQNSDSTDSSRTLNNDRALRAEAEIIEPQPAAPQTMTLNFTGATYDDTVGYFPPDSMGAVGPTQFLVGINGRIRVFDKNTAAVGPLDTTMDIFFDSIRDGKITADPRVRYDRLSGRWFVVIINVPRDANRLLTGTNRVLLAVSDSGIITASTVWTFYYYQQDLIAPPGDPNCFADFPTLGIDEHALYIGVKKLCGIGTTGSYGGTDGYVIRKSSVLSGGPIVVTAFRNLSPISGAGLLMPQGVDNFDVNPTYGYFIGTDNASYGKLMLRRVSNPGTTPTISANIAITVASTTSPLKVPHLGNTGGTNGNIDGIDDRLQCATIRNGRLWTAHNIAVNRTGTTNVTPYPRDRNGIRWYELQNLATTPTVFQFGTIHDTAPTDPLFYWIPAVIVSGQGHAAFGFSVAGNLSYIDCATTGRLATDALGTVVSPSVKCTASTTAYNPPGDPGGTRGRRWGDYGYTSLDPNDDMTMWTIQEFCSSLNTWGVQVVKLLAPAPTLNNPAATACPGTTGLMLALTGTGIFDPGPSFPNRLAIQISGSDVTVTDVTYNSPTSATITIDISPTASPGPRDITLINPDNQTSIAYGGLFIPDTDGDTVSDCTDNCINTTNADQQDTDADSVGDACDICPFTIPGAGVDASGCPPYIPGDFDNDGDVDLADYEHWESCMTGPDIPFITQFCEDADIDQDDDVDQTDFGYIQRCLSGENNPADPNCMN